MELKTTMVQFIILITKLMSPHNALIVLHLLYRLKKLHIHYRFITMYQILQGIICVETPL